MIFKNRQKEVESLVEAYREQASGCVELARVSIEQYCNGGDFRELEQSYAEVHRLESRADDIQSDIGFLLFSESLFPESRGTLLELVEHTDRVTNHAESTVRMILRQHIELPQAYAGDTVELLEVSCRAAKTLYQTVGTLFSNFTAATEGVGKVDQLESEADLIEGRLIERIFSDSTLDGWKKLLLRDFVQHVAHIADRAENVGDLIRIIVAKRSF